ncbi:MAG: hypothetical protein JXB43_02910 [Dehalococcoidia bacterium]|nr:hypothetical protein [Dehalococcoidia bacterium]
MNRKIAGIISLLVLMSISGLLQACAEAQPSFEVLSLDIIPQKITTAERTTVEVEIRNNDVKDATYNVPLMVNGVADDRRSVTLAPGETELLTFTLARSQPGTYSISVGSRESTLVVEKLSPPEFRLSDMEANPAEVNVGGNIVITAKVSNIGGTQGSYTAELKVDGVTIETEQFTIAAGADCKVTFKICECSPGTYTVTLGNLTSKFVVKGPPRPVTNYPTPTSTPTPTNSGCSTRG